ncbi:hypothetical protein [Paraburkholderia metrosideri]|uniref:Integrase n=1 Tax=Paraburkholderia metrosideri TaxID=580937 RepID=A0ABN7HZX3_9BURK|nr:hypothetical protein [Paraburkholderia metrosideri]CAD6542897.1 hypothetical protein LMG28140_03835 [Paraburkholderia metrosideri]
MLRGMPKNLFGYLQEMSLVSELLYRQATWLVSDFDEGVWLLNFGGVRRTIDWRVRFGDGLLTDARHTGTRNLFKSFLVVQTDATLCGGREPVASRANISVAQASRVVDYFLLNQDELKIARNGLSLISKNDVATLMHRYEIGPTDVDAIYDWKSSLSRWLDARLEEVRSRAEQLVDSDKRFAHIAVPNEEWVLKADERKMVLWRAVLWLDGYYNPAGKTMNYKFTPSTTKLSATIYPGTIAGKGPKPVFEELCLNPVDKYVREFPGVNVRTGEGEGPTQSYLSSRGRAVSSFTHLSAAGFDVSVEAFETAREYKPVSPERVAMPGRFRNPPFWQVMDGLKNGIGFCSKHGDEFLTSYGNVLAAAKSEGVTPYGLLLAHDFREFLTPGAIKFGVTQWCLRTHAGTVSVGNRYLQARAGKQRWSREKFYSEFRKGRGLLQNIYVFYGSVVHIVGPMTARRQDELTGLPVEGCLDESRSFIHFTNGKSGAAGLREKEVRPIPPAVEAAFSIIQEFRQRLLNDGITDELGRLFDIPGFGGMRTATASGFNDCIDAFCDFFETPLSDDGARFYLREHQFRRFFIIAFFFSARQGDLGTLRWFVAHADAQHLWNYLTNNVSGDLYREAAAYFLTDELLLPAESRVIEMHESAQDLLSSMVEERFGTRKFSLVDADALEAYLESLIGSEIEVEPEFFPFAANFPYKIICKLKGPR